MKSNFLKNLLLLTSLSLIALPAFAVPIAAGDFGIRAPFTFATPDPSTNPNHVPPGQYDPSLAGTTIYSNAMNFNVPIVRRGESEARFVLEVTLVDRVIRNVAGTLDFYGSLFVPNSGVYSGPFLSRINTIPQFGPVDMGIRSDDVFGFTPFGDFLPSARFSRRDERTFEFNAFDSPDSSFSSRWTGVVYYRTNATNFNLGASGKITVSTSPSSVGEISFSGLAQPDSARSIPVPGSFFLITVGLAAMAMLRRRLRFLASVYRFG